jgi:hypothetical protein
VNESESFCKETPLINLKIQLKIFSGRRRKEEMSGKYNDESYRINEKQEEERETAGIQDNRKGRRGIKILE